MIGNIFKALCLIPLLVACVSEPDVDPNTPDGLLKLGEFYEQNDRYDEAVAQYKSISNKFPYSKLAAEAELKTADCYFKKDEYVEAAAAYRTFKELHPKHPKIDYATYSAAESIREQLPSTVDKDLAQAPQAIAYYNEIVTLYPTSPHAADSKEKRLKLIQMLADKELYIADFYYKQEKYTASLSRYSLFVQDYSQNQRVPYALYWAAKSAEKAGAKERIREFVSPLVSNYPNSPEAKDAKQEFPHAVR